MAAVSETIKSTTEAKLGRPLRSSALIVARCVLIPHLSVCQSRPTWQLSALAATWLIRLKGLRVRWRL